MDGELVSTATVCGANAGGVQEIVFAPAVALSNRNGGGPTRGRYAAPHASGPIKAANAAKMAQARQCLKSQVIMPQLCFPISANRTRHFRAGVCLTKGHPPR
jgi:hypothetical protein